MQTGQGDRYGHDTPVLAVLFDPVRQTLASSGYGQTVRFWNLKMEEGFHGIGNHDSWITSVILVQVVKIAVEGGHQD